MNVHRTLFLCALFASALVAGRLLGRLGGVLSPGNCQLVVGGSSEMLNCNTGDDHSRLNRHRAAAVGADLRT
jgi:hypothetical protein